MKFGENLYNLRKAKKMSQENLAEKMDVSRQSVSKWENGESYPEMDKIMKLCSIFHCKINDLVYEDMSDIDSLDEEIKMSVVKFKKEKQQKIKNVSKAIYIIARIGKILVAAAIPITVIGLAILIYFFVNDENVINFSGIFENTSKNMIIGYLEVGAMFLIAGLFFFRIILKDLENLFVNIYKGDTPFTLENVKYIKEIAFFMVAIIVLHYISSIIFELILKSKFILEINLFDIVEILFLISMSYIFEYGYELQQDTKAKMYGENKEE